MANPSTLASRLETTPIKVNKWNTQEVRVSLDDLVAKYFVEEAHYAEVKTLLYQKLIFTLALTIIGGVTGLYARFTPFATAKLLTGIGASCYMALLGYYTLWLGYFSTSTCFRGRHPSTRKEVWIQSKLELPSAMYYLNLLDLKTGKPATKVAKSWCIGQWVQEDGVISGDAFCASMQKFVTSDEYKSYLKNE